MVIIADLSHVPHLYEPLMFLMFGRHFAKNFSALLVRLFIRL